MRWKSVLLVCLTLAVPLEVRAQQTGSITGKVTAPDGSTLPGVTVEARADVLPGPRVTVTGVNGEYQLPALPPGSYTIKFDLSGMQGVTRKAEVQLGQDTVVDTKLDIRGLTETVNVTAEASLVDRASATITSGLSADEIRGLPLGQEYRDLLKLISGVQYSQETIRGPSAGASGQENVYHFDGVNVTLPLFGTLSAEPASHDIAQITAVKGGARAVDFDRAGGFSVDSVSKSGTSSYRGLLSYQFQNHSMAADLKTGVSRYEKNSTWLDMNLGGPIAADRLFFFASFYRPISSRENQVTSYGTVPRYQSTRNEGFGKLTFTPTHSVLMNFSFRDSHRFEKGDVFAVNAAGTTGTGSESWLKIGTIDGSWIIDAASYLTFKYTHFGNKTQGRPDTEARVTPSTVTGTKLDITGLDTQGRLVVPTIIAGQTAFNAFIQPLIDRYGYIDSVTGLRTGGGIVGYGLEFNKQDFFRDSGQIGYNRTFNGSITHEVHAGYQQYVDSEDLVRRSNGWGLLSIPGGRTSFQGTPIFFTATFSQQSTGAVPPIHSEYRSRSFELNDTIRWGKWSFNVGVLASNDTLYGQDLKEDASALSGYVLAPGNKYKMYDLPFSRMMQPRLGATWSYNGRDTIFASYAQYNPAGSSLPRAASWARNRTSTIDAHFDATGLLFATTPVASSSGKLFVPNMTPPTYKEVSFGTARQLGPLWTGRVYGRYRSGSHFWEDTNNTARTVFNPPETVHGVTVPKKLYIEDLTARLAQITTGSTYVIAELDGAYTKYSEVTAETEWRKDRTFIRGSYTWSHYYGNFDQDNTTTTNDANVFIGSSFIGDGAGRQLWDNRDGDLRGDRRHLIKLFGVRTLNWHATAGAYFVAQSGQPWELWSYEPYVSLTTSTSDVSRYAEKAGARRSPAHAQLDLKYTQSVVLSKKYSAEIVADLFNVTNKQTGYNFQSAFHTSTFGQPRSYFDPRRFQLAFQLLY